MKSEHPTCKRCQGTGVLVGINGGDGVKCTVRCEVCHGFGKIGPWLDGTTPARKKTKVESLPLSENEVWRKPLPRRKDKDE